MERFSSQEASTSRPLHAPLTHSVVDRMQRLQLGEPQAADRIHADLERIERAFDQLERTVEETTNVWHDGGWQVRHLMREHAAHIMREAGRIDYDSRILIQRATSGGFRDQVAHARTLRSLAGNYLRLADELMQSIDNDGDLRQREQWGMFNRLRNGGARVDDSSN
ncbi:hypothetical protein AB1286_03640 [Trinickia sp. NRRL B-1857]|uniref:hypothetical protein n=1 Tax=Trinickia sp. NRRL B-1857 TaxID=3162879 RepID=UPI003D2A05AC